MTTAPLYVATALLLPAGMSTLVAENLMAEALHASPHFLWNREAQAFHVMIGAPAAEITGLDQHANDALTGEITAEIRRVVPDILGIPDANSHWLEPTTVAKPLARIAHVIAGRDVSGAPYYFERRTRSHEHPLRFTFDPGKARLYDTRQAAESDIKRLVQSVPENIAIAACYAALAPRS